MDIKHIEDYYEKVHEKFPELSIKQIDRILKFGFRSFYTHNLYGGDTLNKSPYFTMYCGKLFGNNLLFYNYWLIKMKIKLRIKYKKNKTRYNGYYYFGLTEEKYQEYLNQFPNKKSRRRKKIHFDEIMFFKILDEVTMDKKFKHIFKTPYPIDNGFTFMRRDFYLKDFEYIYKRKKDNSIEPISYEQKRNK